MPPLASDPAAGESTKAKPKAGELKSSTSQDTPLERYISILETVAPFADGLTSAELEIALDLPKTSVNRLLHALINSGLISVHNGRNRNYRLGDRVFRLLNASPDTSWLETLAQHPLQKLADTTGQSAYISRFDGEEIRSVTCVSPDTPVRTYVMPGMPMPVNATASAKAILAFQDPDTVERMISRPLQAYTEQTKTDVNDLARELREIQTNGFATDKAEHVPGLGSIAFPIRVPDVPVAHAVGLTGPYSLILETAFEANCEAISETAARLAKLLQMRVPAI